MEDADKNSKSLVLITRVGSTPTTGIKKKRPDFVGTFLFYMRYILRAPAVLFRLIPPLQGVFFAARIYSRSAARHFRERLPVLPKGRTIPEKKASKPCSDHLFHLSLIHISEPTRP